MKKTKARLRKLIITSEGDVYDRVSDPATHLPDWTPSTKAEREFLTLWERGMSVFRNWKAAREDRPFSQVETCWLPNVTLDKEPLLILSSEFSSAGCWLARDREADGSPCLPTRKVKGALDALLAATKLPAGVSAKIKETDTNYFEIVVETDSGSFESAVAFVKALSPKILADKTLSYARENIC